MRAMRVAIIVLAVLHAMPVAAEDARLAAARTAYDELQQERVLALLEPALAGTLSDHDRAAALRLEGCAHMVLGDPAAAKESFKRSFAIEPDAALEPQLASPDARKLFELALGEWHGALVDEMEAHAADIAKLKILDDAPKTARGGAPLAIGLGVEDPGKLVERVELAYRKRGQYDFTLLAQPPHAHLTFEIPAETTESDKPFALEYHVTLRHRTGFDLRRDGDAVHPHVIAVSAGHRPKWHELWWVRGAVAVGIAGLGAGGYLFYRSIDVGAQHVVAK